MTDLIKEMGVYLSFVMSLLAFGAAIWARMTHETRANSKVLEERERTIQMHDRRLDQLETRLAVTPSNEVLHALELSLTRIEGALGIMNQRLEPLESITGRVQEVMMNSGNK